MGTVVFFLSSGEVIMREPLCFSLCSFSATWARKLSWSCGLLMARKLSGEHGQRTQRELTNEKNSRTYELSGAYMVAVMTLEANWELFLHDGESPHGALSSWPEVKLAWSKFDECRLVTLHGIEGCGGALLMLHPAWWADGSQGPDLPNRAWLTDVLRD